MAILIKNKDRILGQILDALQDSGVLSDLRAGGAAFTNAEIAAAHLSDLYASLEANTALGYLSTARGPFLDLLADLLQIFRLPEQAAVVLREEKSLRFFVTSGTLSAVISSKVITAGTEIASSDGTVTYQVLEDVPFNDVATEVFVGAVSLDTGATQNVGAGELNTHNLGLPTVFVTNDFAISAAADIETDNQLRSRMADAMLSRATGNIASLREASNIVPGVSEVRIRSHVNGPGTVEMTIIPVGNNPGNRVNEVSQANVEVVRSAGCIVDIKGPRFVPFEVTILLRFRPDVGEGEKPAIRLAAQQAIVGYLETLRLGQQFVVKEMIQQVMDVNERILDFDIHCFAFRRRAQVIRNFQPDTDELIIPDQQLDEPIKVL